MPTYQLPTGQTTDQQGVMRHEDGGGVSGIPNHPDNIDWRAYQAWLAEGNTPLPPDQHVALAASFAVAEQEEAINAYLHAPDDTARINALADLTLEAPR